MKLQHKISLLLLLPLLVLCMGLLLVGHLDLQRRFVQHAQQTEMARITPMLELISLNYQQHQGWDFLQPQAGRQRLPRHVRIEDSQGRLLYGQPGSIPNNWQWFDIQAEGQSIGRLGLPRQQQLLLEADQLFASQIQRQMLWLLLSVLLIVPLLAWLLAKWVSKPLAEVRQSLSLLNRGQYDLPLDVQRADELGQLARDLQQLGKSLALNQQTRQQWLADMAHELRTPLAVLQADLEAMQDGIRPLDQPSIGRLWQQSQRLNRLVNDLAELARSDQSQLHYQLQPLDLAEQLQHWLAEQDCSALELRCQLQKVTLYGDDQRLNQLWGNLFSNSLKYGGNPLTLELIGQHRPEGYALIWQDAGKGVAAEHWPRLFDRLYRVDPADQESQPPGQGLGLAIARQIVERHGGQIRAMQSPLGGLAIEMFWPRELLA